MLAYNVTINGKRVSTVGMKGDGLIFLKADWMRLSVADGITFPNEGEARFIVHGLRTINGVDEHLEWVLETLKVGDTITLELLETDVVDTPKRIEKKPKHKDDTNAQPNEQRQA